MYLRNVTSLIAIFSIFSLNSVKSAENDNLRLTIESLPTVNSQLQTVATNMISKNRGNDERPEACPLESKKNIDILTKIQNIKTLFKENCLDTDQNKLDEILSGAVAIQQQIDSAAKTTTDTSDSALAIPTLTDVSTFDVGGVQLNGEAVANILSNINQIYKSRSCSTINNDLTFLEKTSGVISDFAKIGLLVPNQYSLMIAGGGIALSSILTIINSIIEKRFDFEKTVDRQSFIKLNCAFYDVRRDIEKSGFLDVATKSHKEDAPKIEQALKDLEAYAKELDEANKKGLEIMEKAKTSYIEEKLGFLHDLKTLLNKLLPNVTTKVESNARKLEILNTLALSFNQLNTLANQFVQSGVGQVVVMDAMFVNEISKVDTVANTQAFNQLVQSKLEDFNSQFVQSLEFHFKRVLEIIALKEAELSKDWESKVLINGVKLADYIKARTLESKKIIDSYNDTFGKLKQTDIRIKRILAEEDGYTSSDDGTENIVNILQDYTKIVEQIYGKYGDKFLEYTTKKARKENKSFVKKFKKFAKEYLIHENNDGREFVRVPETTDLSELRVKFACQDAKPYRAKWKFAESLTQQGFDFVATNGDLFHADIPRIFLGTSGGRFGIHGFLNKFERIQMHYKSAVFANKILKKQPVSKEYRKKYIKKHYLGKIMLEVEQTRYSAQLLQGLIEKFNCSKATTLE